MLQGYIDGFERDRIYGWMRDSNSACTSVALLVSIDDLHVFRIIADRSRADLVAAGIGPHSFDLVLEPPLSPLVPHVLRLMWEDTGEECPGSPRLLPSRLVFDAATRKYIAAALADYEDEAEFNVRLDFLQQQASRLKLHERETRAAAHDRFAELKRRGRWAAYAEVHENEARTLRVLAIDEVLPRIGHDAGSSALVSHCVAFRALGHHVVLAGADMEPNADTAWAREAGIELVHGPACTSIEELLRLDQGMFDLVYLHRWTTAARYLPLMRFYLPEAKVIFAVADLEHLRRQRQAAVEERPELVRAARQIKHHEIAIARASDLVLTHSPTEASILKEAVPSANIAVVPWAIEARPGDIPFAERSGLAFVGHYKHEPNVAAVLWLIDEIMPMLWKREPTMLCTLVGSAMPQLLTQQDTRIRSTGPVEDLGTALSDIRLTVAPLTYGAGIKGKVLESFALGIPCVCTPVAAEGLEFGPALRSIVASGAAGMADAIRRVYRDEGLHAACRQEGLDLVTRFCAPNYVETLIRNALRSIDLPSCEGSRMHQVRYSAV